MADNNIEEKVKKIIVEQLTVNPDQVTPDAKFVEDLGADSLDNVELIMALEEEFDIGEMSEEDLASIKTVGDLVNYLQSKLDI